MMSGTSLDGVDLAFSEYNFSSKWSFELKAAKTFPYSEGILESISIMQNVKTTFLKFKEEEIKYSTFIA